MKRKNELKEVKVKLRVKEGKGHLPLAKLHINDLEAVVDDGAIRAINEDMEGLHKNIRNDNIKSGLDPSKLRNYRINSVRIETSETVIQHSLGVKPYDYRVVLRGAGAWYQVKDPDPSNIYIAVTGTATTDYVDADIIVEG